MTITWPPAALADLSNVYTYIADDSSESAERVVRAIVDAAEGLVNFPLMGREGAVPGTRERIMSRYRYKIIYRVQNDHIELVHVLLNVARGAKMAVNTG